MAIELHTGAEYYHLIPFTEEEEYEMNRYGALEWDESDRILELLDEEEARQEMYDAWIDQLIELLNEEQARQRVVDEWTVHDEFIEQLNAGNIHFWEAGNLYIEDGDRLLIPGVSVNYAAPPAGGGSFSDVFNGVYCGKRVAVKRLRTFLDDNGHDKLFKRFWREVNLWRTLNHPRILPFLGIDDDAWKTYGALTMVSPWMAQGTLMQYLKNRASYSIARTKFILRIAEGLQYLHGLSLAHGDLHWSNVFVDEYGCPVIADFGLTANTDMTELVATTTVNKAGAIRWLAPELIHQDDGPPPRKTTSGDIFAFGRLCLSIYTRRVPYHEITPDTGVLLRVIQNRQPSRSSIEECYGKAIDTRLWAIMNHCWVTDPEMRPTIDEVIRALRVLPRLKKNKSKVALDA